MNLVGFIFFFQAEDGIRDHCVTGVQTCALPILSCRSDLDEAGLVGEDDRLYSVAQVELLEDAGDMSLDGSVADDELGRDLGVRKAARKALQNFELAGG